jgi:predicted transposase/invertase (TIGR01784 family)
MYVIKNLDRLDDIPEKLRECVFERFFAAAELAKFSKKEYRAYVKHIRSYWDYYNCLDYAKEEGRVEGRTEGRVEGRTEEKLEIAKKLKTDGMPFDKIHELTDLTIEEIEKI